MTDRNVSAAATSAQTSRRASLAGLFGSGFALLCCAGVAPVLGLLAAIGLGFLIHDAILIPLLVVALGVTGWGLWQGRRCHGSGSPLLLGLGGGALAVGGCSSGSRSPSSDSERSSWPASGTCGCCARARFPHRMNNPFQER